MKKLMLTLITILNICVNLSCSTQDYLEGRWVLDKTIAIGNGKKGIINSNCPKESYLIFKNDSINGVDYSKNNYSDGCKKSKFSSKYKLNNEIITFNNSNNIKTSMQILELKKENSLVLKFDGLVTILRYYKTAPPLPNTDFNLEGKWIHNKANGVQTIITFENDNKVTYLVKRNNFDITETIFGVKKKHLQLSYEFNKKADPKELDIVVHNTKKNTTNTMLGIIRFINRDSIEIKTSILKSRPEYFDTTNPEIFTRLN